MFLDKKIKVVCVLEATLGGTRKYCTEYLSRLDHDKYELIYIYSLERADEQFYEDLTILRNQGIHLKEIPIIRKISLIKDVVSLIKLTLFLYRHTYSIIHLHSSKAGFLGRIASFIARNKAVRIYHPHMIAVKLGKIYLLLEKIAGYLTHYIIAESQSEAELLKKFRLVPDKKLVVITAGVEVYHSDKPDPPYCDGSELPIQIGSIGRLTYPKDPFTLIRAAKILKDKAYNFQCYWIGEGELLNEAQALIRQLDLENTVYMMGWQKDVQSWIKKFAIIVHSSYYEAFGLAVAEAMSFGKPIVASNISGIKDLVRENQTGFLYQAGNEMELSSFLEILLKDRKKVEEFGKMGKQLIIDNYTIEKTVSEIDRLYQKVLIQSNLIATGA